jgi:UDP-N-acetylglucosamine 1-carboxyvinyltransferase
VRDVGIQLEILQELGAGVRPPQRGVGGDRLPPSDVVQRGERASTRALRASYYLIGALLGRFGRAEVTMPGGCNFGVRPIDQHIKGFTAMGAEVEVDGGFIHARAKDGHLRGAQIYLDVVSVGATMNIMLAAVLAEGTTVIENAAKEPHIVDLANFLNSMGADVMGAGTDVIKIRGVPASSRRQLFDHTRPDRGRNVYGGGAATGGRCWSERHPQASGLHNRQARESWARSRGVRRQRARLAHGADPQDRTSRRCRIPASRPTCSRRWPPCSALAEGTSVITEGVWENRYRYVDELQAHGRHIQVDGKIAIIEGVDRLYRRSGAGLRPARRRGNGDRGLAARRASPRSSRSPISSAAMRTSWASCAPRGGHPPRGGAGPRRAGPRQLNDERDFSAGL